MEDTQEAAKQGRMTAIKALFVALMIIGIIIIAWGMTMNEDNTKTRTDTSSQSSSSSQSLPQEPSNPNATGAP